MAGEGGMGHIMQNLINHVKEFELHQNFSSFKRCKQRNDLITFTLQDVRKRGWDVPTVETVRLANKLCRTLVITKLSPSYCFFTLKYTWKYCGKCKICVNS